MSGRSEQNEWLQRVLGVGGPSSSSVSTATESDDDQLQNALAGWTKVRTKAIGSLRALEGAIRGMNHPAGEHSAFSKDGSRLLYNHNGPTAPSDLWVYQLATAKSHQVTHSLVAGVRSEDMVEPFLVHYPSRDGKWSISAFVYVPYNMVRNGQNAAIVYVHGGPTA